MAGVVYWNNRIQMEPDTNGIFTMDALIIKSKNRSDLKLISDLVKKMGLESKSLSEEEIEDLGLTILMKQADRTKTVSRETVMRKLGGE
jgi:hypothetical protein